MNRKSPSPPEPGAPQSPPAPAAPAASAASAAGGPSFEVAIKRLGEIVQTLEKGDMPLEESLRLFEEGVKLSRVSQQRLDAAEKRVEQLLAVDAEGRAKTQPFATDAADEGDEREPDEGVPF
jgi:exodeoxyribonuclease VII small subunit